MIPKFSVSLSRIEGLASAIDNYKQTFLLRLGAHAKRCTTEKAGSVRLKRIFEAIDQETIQNMYNSHTKRLHNGRKANE